MIEINNISKEYKKNKKVINNLSMKINNGEIFGFLGPNGAGKTTTIKMITGILEVDEGDILIDNYSIKSKPVEAKKNIGLVLDNPDVYDVSEKQRISVIKNLSEIFELKDVLNNKIQSYSHGMKQKLAIISSLLNNPKNWILDEPMTGLDPKSFFELKNLMREHAQNGNAVFFSTHILDVAEKLCDRVAIINEGKLLFIGTYQEMKDELEENKSLEELFMEITNNE